MFETMIIIAGIILAILGFGLWMGARFTMGLKKSTAGGPTRTVEQILNESDRQQAIKAMIGGIFVSVTVYAVVWTLWAMFPCRADPTVCDNTVLPVLKLPDWLPWIGGALHMPTAMALLVMVWAAAEALAMWGPLPRSAAALFQIGVLLSEVAILIWLLFRAVGYTF